MNKVYGFNQQQRTCCGVMEVGYFEELPLPLLYGHYKLEDLTPHGTGMFTATFTQAQEHFKEELCKKHELLFDSGWMFNNNSHNEMCLCVFHHADWQQNEADEEDEYEDEDNE